MKLSNSELNVMNVLWRHGSCTAKEISTMLEAEIGWNINTTYTTIKKCITKGAIRREEPGFLCFPLVTREAVRESETTELVSKLYDGSFELLFASLVSSKKLTPQQIRELRAMIANLEDE